MILTILEPLAADPPRVLLPAEVTLRQRLQSDAPPEQVRLSYSLDTAGDVWFDTPNGPSKTLDLDATVESSGALTPQPAARLVRGSGVPAKMARIDEVITDSAKQDTTDHCEVQTPPDGVRLARKGRS
jgi:hypothetical protein